MSDYNVEMSIGVHKINRSLKCGIIGVLGFSPVY